MAETNDLCPTAVVVMWPGFEPRSPSKPQLHSTPTPLQLPDVPWGIISIKAQDEDCETPMQVCRCGEGAEALFMCDVRTFHVCGWGGWWVVVAAAAQRAPQHPRHIVAQPPTPVLPTIIYEGALRHARLRHSSHRARRSLPSV